MKIAILHYHLRPGGVTTVIRRQIESLSGYADLLVITGEEPPAPMGVPVAVIPQAGYDGSGASALGKAEPSADSAAQAIQNAIRDAFGGDCDVLHVHNPTLRKNSRFLKVLRILQDRGLRLFLHVHDLGEDGRPRSYFHADDYPSDCHYGVLNGRDYRALLESGLKPEGLHLLFNSVTPLEVPAGSADRRGAVYPVRAIRRKNIGEALLLSLFLPPGERLSVTLPPTSERDFPPYEAWRGFARDRELPVAFEAGLQSSLPDILAASRCVITTSLKEGFGFAFLEPWTAGLPVSGRRLEAVCPDFESQGVRLPKLYEALKVPKSLFSFNRFASDWKTLASAHFRSFGRRLRKREGDELFDETFPGDWADFGFLDERAQAEVIEAAALRPEALEGLAADNPFLKDIFASEGAGLIAENDRVIRSRYSLERYRDALLETYRAVAESPVRHSIDRERLLDFFLRGQRFTVVSSEASL